MRHQLQRKFVVTRASQGYTVRTRSNFVAPGMSVAWIAAIMANAADDGDRRSGYSQQADRTTLSVTRDHFDEMYGYQDTHAPHTSRISSGSTVRTTVDLAQRRGK